MHIEQAQQQPAAGDHYNNDNIDVNKENQPTSDSGSSSNNKSNRTDVNNKQRQAASNKDAHNNNNADHIDSIVQQIQVTVEDDMEQDKDHPDVIELGNNDHTDQPDKQHTDAKAAITPPMTPSPNRIRTRSQSISTISQSQTICCICSISNG